MAQDDDGYFNAHRRIDEAMDDYEKERTKAAEGHASRTAARSTLRSKDNAFSMTFDGRGELVDLAFHGTKFRSMAPRELAGSLMATLQQGRLEAIEKMASTFDSPMLKGVDFVGLATGKADPSKVIDSLLGSLTTGLSDRPGAGFGRDDTSGDRRG